MIPICISSVYMLDEPLNGIDLLARDEVMKMVLTSASEDNIMIISSHLVEELEALVDRAIFIKDAPILILFVPNGIYFIPKTKSIKTTKTTIMLFKIFSIYNTILTFTIILYQVC